MTSLLSASARVTTFGIDEFRQHANQGAAVAVVRDRSSHNASVTLIALGETPDGRSVAWVEAGEETARHFVDALSTTFGAGIAEETSRTLRLDALGARPLPSKLVHEAINMAEVARTTLDGVEFMQALTEANPSRETRMHRYDA